ncbi:MAG TPA: nitrate- and nitrite sensing domain-containing protein [Streptosporangiaceae bacterium]|nr:nitrate- and nitrite sensing domain-containing protein [Streptosporangiaceae bacterium]
MGNHRVASAGPRAVGPTYVSEAPATTSHFTSPSALNLRNWPVSTRLIAVIVLALLMGLVFGGLRVVSATDSADEFGRVSHLAALGQQVTGLVQALEDERDETAGLLPVSDPKALKHWYAATDAAAAKVRTLAAGIGGSYPANIQSQMATVLSVINNHTELENTAQASQSALSVIADYAPPINDMIALNNLIAEGTSDASLVSDVQTLNSLSVAKDQAAQQRALLFNAFRQKIFADGEQQALTSAESQELVEETAFRTTATPAEQRSFNNTVAGPLFNQAQEIEIYVEGLPLGTISLDIGQSPLGIGANAAPSVWYAAQSGKVDDMQQVGQGIARSIVSRAQSLQHGAQSSALFSAILTAVILLLVLLATVAVARSLVGPLRKLREGALNIATVELPERVRLLGEAQDPSTSLEVAPIDVLSADEIGQVARAFDQVHSEAVRLAGNEAMLRNSFNAMFVNLSRRSQSLIERLVRMIDSLEQNEGDPERLSNLFAMDHLVTRMRRNSENLLLLAGHESARKWSDPVSLADVARAAVSEIEQYSRVTLKIQPGMAVTGQAVSDVVHLLAEVIENATIFSAKDTPVHVAAQELTSGGVLIEVSDNGVGIPEARLAEMNWRLDNPPVMDVSVSRHMGLFAVARLAERHGVRVRLRPRSPHGLIALVWLPDGVTEREADLYGARSRTFAMQGRGGSGGNGMPARAVPEALPGNHRNDVIVPDHAATGAREPGISNPGISIPGISIPGISNTGASNTGPVAGATAATSDWFRSRPSGDGAAAGNGNGSGGAAAASQPAVQPTGLPTGQQDGRGAGRNDGWTVGRHAAQIVAEPVRGDFTSAGLPTRVPQANLIPGSVAGGRSAGANAPSRPGSGPAQAPITPRSPRSPDVARNRLSGFQRGVRRAKGLTPDDGEGADH